MKKEFYTFVGSKLGKILYRGYTVEDGVRKRIHGRIPYKPTLYVETPEPSVYKSLFGKNLLPKQFQSISESKEYITTYGDVREIYGYNPNRVEYDFISKNFPGETSVLLEELVAIGFDIETEVGVSGPKGFPDAATALERITHIAFENHHTGEVVSYTTAKVKNLDEENTTNTVFNSETELLEALISYIETVDPDIMYGFYSDNFDVPYIINRIRNVLGDDAVNRLSPFGIVTARDYSLNGRQFTEYNIVGRTLYDIQAMYMKFVLTKRESYSLDALCKIELGVGKLENPCSTFKEFSEAPQHVDTFARYNVIDTKRLTELDKKCGLLSLAVALAYLTKSNFTDVFSPVRYWECYIMSILANENTFVSVNKQRVESATILGAYVSDPVPGFYDWVVSIDATSLYPSIMKCLNLSPETFDGMVDGVTVDGMLSGKTYKDYGVSDGYTLAANGAKFSKEKIGIVPRLVDTVLVGRRTAKNEMLRYKQLYVDIETEALRRGILL